MGEFEKSCVNCGVLNCAKRDKEYPEFCLTTNFDVKELEEIKKLYLEDEENNKVSVFQQRLKLNFIAVIREWRKLSNFQSGWAFIKLELRHVLD